MLERQSTLSRNQRTDLAEDRGARASLAVRRKDTFGRWSRVRIASSDTSREPFAPARKTIALSTSKREIAEMWSHAALPDARSIETALGDTADTLQYALRLADFGIGATVADIGNASTATGGSPSTYLNDSIIEHLATVYEFRGSDVEPYLRRHVDLPPLLLDIALVAAEYFGSSERLALEVMDDPESDDDAELFVVINTSLAPEIALATLRAFDEGWWFDRVRQIGNLVTVTLEYV